MRILALALALVPAMLAAPALAQDPKPAPGFSPPDFTQTPSDDAPQSQIDQWFDKLASARNERDGQVAAGHIQQIWMKSGSDTVDLLMGWALQAVTDEDLPLALDLLDAVTTLKPDFAEGWNKRATVEYMQDHYDQALSDIARVLAIEPRHFGALSGLGMILRELDQNERALDALKRALALNPYLENVPDLVDELERKVSQDI